MPVNVTRVYVAAASSEARRASEFCSRLAEVPGIRVICDWPEAVICYGANEGLSDEVRAKAYEACVSGVMSCDMLVLLWPQPPNRTIGAWVELGVALARRIPVVAIRPRKDDSIFVYPCVPYRTEEEFLSALRGNG